MLINKSRLLALSTLAALAAAPELAQANAALVQDFKAQAQVLPRRALSAGYRQFGALDLSDALYRMQSEVDVRTVGKVAHKQDLGVLMAERDGAQWRPGSVAVSAARWPKTRAAAKPMLALHEMLGALRIEDDNFGCSGTIWVLTDPAVRATMNREELGTFEGYAHQACQVARGGGSTGVTGGGDDYNVEIRMNLMNQTLQEMQAARSHEERSAAFSRATGSFYQGYGRKRTGSYKDFGDMLNAIRLDRRPIPSTIRVFEDLEMTQEIPQNARHGWTYDARTNTVHIHGKYRRKREGAMSMSPGILFTRAE
jgi:hypothetical protein